MIHFCGQQEYDKIPAQKTIINTSVEPKTIFFIRSPRGYLIMSDNESYQTLLSAVIHYYQGEKPEWSLMSFGNNEVLQRLR